MGKNLDENGRKQAMTNNIFYQNYTQHAKKIVNISFEGLKNEYSYYKNHFLGLLPKDKECRILDGGCGHGRILYMLEKEGYKNVYGIDISSQQIEAAKSFGFKNVSVGKIEEFLPDHLNEFDVIILCDVLEHFKKENLPDIVKSIYNSLKEGGIFIFQAPNAISPMNVHRYWDLTHEISFSYASCLQLLSLSGFIDIKIYPIEPHIHGIKSFIRYLLWKGLILNVIRLYMLISNGNLMGGIYTSNLLASGRKISNGKNIV